MMYIYPPLLLGLRATACTFLWRIEIGFLRIEPSFWIVRSLLELVFWRMLFEKALPLSIATGLVGLGEPRSYSVMEEKERPRAGLLGALGLESLGLAKDDDLIRGHIRSKCEQRK